VDACTEFRLSVLLTVLGSNGQYRVPNLASNAAVSDGSFSMVMVHTSCCRLFALSRSVRLPATRMPLSIACVMPLMKRESVRGRVSSTGSASVMVWKEPSVLSTG